MILGSIILVIVVLAAQFLKRDPAQMGQIPYGKSNMGEQGLKSGDAGFSLKEAACTRQLWMSFAMFICCGFCVFSIMVHIAPHATDMGISAARAANILAAIGGATIVGKVVLGSAADIIGNKRVFAISFILVSASSFWLVPATEVWMLYPFAIVFGFAWSGLATAQSPLIAGLFGLSSHGLIFGVMGLGLTIGGAIGPFLTGYIFDITGRYQLAFLVCATIGIIGLVLTLLLTPIRGERG